MDSASTVVIKVKYGDMTRRFNAHIIGGELEVTLDGLKEKIFSLFNIDPDVELILRYIDEDGDAVHLVDADDLRDVVKQGLNPVRISVRLISPPNASQSGCLTEDSTSVRLNNLQAGVTEVLKAVPEPFLETLVNLSSDLSKVLKSSSPHVAEIVDTVSKVGLTYLGQSSDSKTSGRPSKNNEPENSSLFEDLTAVKVDATKLKVPSTSGQEQAVDSSESLKNDQMEFANVPGKEEGKLPSRLPVLNHKWLGHGPRTVCTVKKPKIKKVKELFQTEGEAKKPVQFRDRKMKIASSYDPKRHSGPSPTTGCLIPGISDGGQYFPSFPPVFHSGVRCDGCGIYPITGPRFKSNVKFDYDLCLVCFAKMGNRTGYIRMDRPAVYQNLDSLNGLCNSAQTQSEKLFSAKLDSCFIDDVNIFDGTVMAPLASFTKIWRMWNSGTAEWPQGTQLVCIGGDLMRCSLTVGLEIPKSGVLVGQVQDIAVDFVAPELPGQYISYWRLVSPSGKQFGQRVWVIIEVDASLPKLPPLDTSDLYLNLPAVDSSPPKFPRLDTSDLYLNLPAVSCSLSGSTGINLDPVPIAGGTQPQAENNRKTVEPVVEIQPQAENNRKTVEPVVEIQPHAENNRMSVEIVEPVVEKQPQTENNKKTVEIVKPVFEMQPQTENCKKTVEIVEPVVKMRPRTAGNKVTVVLEEPIFFEMQPQTIDNGMTVELVEPVGELQPDESQEMKFVDNLLVFDGASSSPFTSPSDPFLSLANNRQPPPVTTADSGASDSGLSVPDHIGNVVDSPSPSSPVSTLQGIPGEIDVEEKLLEELEEMGFKEVGLNKEILRKNEYDLEQAVDDLCDVSDWDPMLEELDEMGFRDTEINKKLLEKNNGSIMRVVLDLIAGEKA